MVYQQEISLRTQRPGQMHDLTGEVRRIVQEAKVRTGLVQIFNVGSTAAIGTIEYEPGLQKDLPRFLERLIPAGGSYAHEETWHDGNGHSHLQATLLGPSLTVPIQGSEPRLGTWQQIFHLECDVRPRERTVVVTVMGE